ncbi:hypothetical protein GWK47_044187 [Chionoecetes opilio]|uniref:Uncharacterized protein n=1 Tax=Chionoecetes opilio TaxID=41210 RepID=A0A8J5CIW4_CHIOP|nr:hypothetical protein GWK47_044187 [Chionoecetes opilio]
MFVADLLKPANKSRDTSQDNFTMAVSKELRGRKLTSQNLHLQSRDKRHADLLLDLLQKPS